MCRWEAGQKLFGKSILAAASSHMSNDGVCGLVSPSLIAAVQKTLNAEGVDASLKAYALSAPSLSTLAEEMEVVDPDALTSASKHVKQAIASRLRDDLIAVYKANVLPAEPFRQDAEAVGMRRLKNVCLDYLSTLVDSNITALALDQLKAGGALTDVVAALQVHTQISPHIFPCSPGRGLRCILQCTLHVATSGSMRCRSDAPCSASPRLSRATRPGLVRRRFSTSTTGMPREMT